jgi:hypothetical protein
MLFIAAIEHFRFMERYNLSHSMRKEAFTALLIAVFLAVSFTHPHPTATCPTSSSCSTLIHGILYEI